jgi:hypothetical protein
MRAAMLSAPVADHAGARMLNEFFDALLEPHRP